MSAGSKDTAKERYQALAIFAEQARQLADQADESADRLDAFAERISNYARTQAPEGADQDRP